MAGSSASTCASSSGVGASAPPHPPPAPIPPPPPPPTTRTAAVGLAVRVRSAIWALADLLVGRGRATPTGVMPSTCPSVGHGLGGFDGLEPFGVAARPREQHPVERAARPELVVRSGVEHVRRGRPRRCGRPATSVERRCAMRIVVRVLAIRRSVAWISSSMRESTDEVASSSSRILRIGEQRPCERDALALTAREREALLADDRVVALRAAAG